jgi:hypothetical protein
MLKIPFHVTFLKDELVRRKVTNPAYSLRAFASALRMHPSALSRVLCCKQELSVSSCIVLVPRIVFSSNDKETFITSVAEEKMHRALIKMTNALKLVLAS